MGSAISQGDKVLQEKQVKKKSESLVQKLDKKHEKRKYVDKEKSSAQPKDTDDNEVAESSSKKVKKSDTHLVKEKDRGLGVVKKGDSAKSVSDKNRKKNPVKNT